MWYFLGGKSLHVKWIHKPNTDWRFPSFFSERHLCLNFFCPTLLTIFSSWTRFSYDSNILQRFLSHFLRQDNYFYFLFFISRHERFRWETSQTLAASSSSVMYSRPRIMGNCCCPSLPLFVVVVVVFDFFGFFFSLVSLSLTHARAQPSRRARRPHTQPWCVKRKTSRRTHAGL